MDPVFAITPDTRAYLIQNSDGTIQVSRPITVYTDDGRAYLAPQPEYLIGAPVAVDSNSDTVASLNPGAVSVALTVGASPGMQNLTFTIDPTWLRDAHRVFPVRLDVPIVTSASDVRTGVFGTVNSCASAMVVPPTQVIVGNEGACAYHGQAFFDTSVLPPNTSIQSAVLHLYTPDQTGPTGVQVYQNAAAPDPLGLPRSWSQPSWQTAAPVVTGSVGLAQSASNGQWQTWDVTSIVRQWVQSAHTNAGMTLVGSGSPVRFAWPLSSGSNDPITAPYLEITYAPNISANTNTVDNSQDIYGVSGTFANTCLNGAIVCGQTLAVDQVKALTGSYIRIGVQLNCNSRTPGGTAWWNTAAADPSNVGTINAILQRASADNLIPIVDLLPTFGSSCSPSVPMDATTWNQETQDFVKYEIGSGLPYPASKMIYFEIGNEPNTSNYRSYGGSAQNYGSDYANAASGLDTALNKLSDTTFYVVTGGMAQPTATFGNIHEQCYDPWGRVNIEDADYALNQAVTMGVPASHLAAGVHPYSYNTAESNYWLNYYNMPPGPSGEHNHFYGVCGDISSMISLWSQNNTPLIPLVFTEDDWSAQPLGEQDCSDQQMGCEGTYLIDLFTWLADHNGYNQPSSSLLRVAWFRGVDLAPNPAIGFPGQPLGIYGSSGGAKTFTVYSCKNFPSLQTTHTAISDAYSTLALGITGIPGAVFVGCY